MDGSNVYLFTDLNPFKLALLLERGKVKTTAKSGDIAAMDVVVPAGNTGQPPGPIISQLNGVGLPTRIESGSVWVSKDTLVVRRGEEINEHLAGVLSKLDIKAVELGISMRAVYDDGLMIVGDQLKVDVDATRRSVEASNQEAFALAMGISLPNQRHNQATTAKCTPESHGISRQRSNTNQRNNRRPNPQSKRGNDKPQRRSRQSQTKNSLNPSFYLIFPLLIADLFIPFGCWELLFS